jgi:type I restriction enzyme S subunit
MVREGAFETSIGELAAPIKNALVGGPFGSNLGTADYVSAGVPVIRGQNLGNGKFVGGDFVFVSDEKADQLKANLARPGDLVFTQRGNAVLHGGQVAIVPLLPFDRYLVSQSQMKLTPDPAKVEPLFLYFIFTSAEYRHYLQSNAVVTGVPHINLGLLREYSFWLPPLAEQGAIARVLGALDDKIELNRRMNATLETMARALFQSWFVDFDPVRAKLDGRHIGSLDSAVAASFPEHLEDSIIGKKPAGWDVTTLDRTLSILETGGRPKGGVGGISEGVPSIGAESIVGVGQFDFGKTKFVPVDFHARMTKGRIASHDVLLYKDGGRPGEYEPHVSMFGNGFPFEVCSINEHVYRLRTNERLSQEYLYFWLTSERSLAEMRTKGTGVAIPGLNSSAVRSLSVLVPPPAVVEAFTRQAPPHVTQIFANARQSRTLATLRDTLLPKLLSGELTVGDYAIRSSRIAADEASSLGGPPPT